MKTLPYPGYPDRYAATDRRLHCALAKGTSIVTESIFENTISNILMSLPEWEQMIKVEGNSATIEGVEKFYRSKCQRTGSYEQEQRFVIAGLAADGHHDRG